MRFAPPSPRAHTVGDAASGETASQRTVSDRCWSVILTCEVTEGKINAERLPGLPYSSICTLAASRLSYDILPSLEGF